MGRDGVRKGLIWMGQNKSLRLGTPKTFKSIKNSLKFCLCGLGKNVKYKKKTQFNTKYRIPNVLPSITFILAVFLKVNIFNQ